MSEYSSWLNWIDKQSESMLRLVTEWANINTGSKNIDGLRRFISLMCHEFSSLNGKIEKKELPAATWVNSQGFTEDVRLANAIRITKRPLASIKVFLCGHMDTVFGVQHPFQEVTLLDETRINGPGVADMKGGLVIILKALQALERSPFAKGIGWEVLVTPDEEIGSHGSSILLKEAASRNHIGLVFEPAISKDGTFARARKGHGKFTLVIRGKAAHAGREHHLGKNAICAMSETIGEIDALNGQRDGVTLNVGIIEGGSAVNTIPDLCISRFECRISNEDDEIWINNHLEQIIDTRNQKEGYSAEIKGGFARKPKKITPQIQMLFDLIAQCGTDLEYPISWDDTGGCCDGNNLAAQGLPNIDTLGAIGENIHSDKEFLVISSLTERAKLTSLLLMKLGNREIKLSLPVQKSVE